MLIMYESCKVKPKKETLAQSTAKMKWSFIIRSRSLLPWPRPVACLPDFHQTYQLGALIGAGAFAKVHLATVKVNGPYKDMQVAVKCTRRQNLPREDKEDLFEEVGNSTPVHSRAWHEWGR